ncbi:MAG: RpiB/LacA/LacB family sugar-phosphate isomerase [Planctomycetia bacterium]|nr:RpiB/LacA/LacB family sugar-phosphate isomerase [Planctomycetia bacterium]
MAERTWDIDDLVGKIMSDLRASGVTSDSSASSVSVALTQDFRAVRGAATQSAGAKKVESAEPVVEQPSVFEIPERVATLNAVKRWASQTSCKTWQAPVNAVITPSVLDWLKKEEITLVHACQTPKKSSRSVGAGNVSVKVDAKKTPCLVAVCLPNEESAPRGLMHYLERNAELSVIRLDCLKTTSQEISERVNADGALRVVVTTHDSAKGLIWLNRLSGVRAVLATGFEQTKYDVSSTNANVLVVDPRRVGPYQLRQIVDIFLQQS